MPRCHVCGNKIPLLKVDLVGENICKQCTLERSEKEKNRRKEEENRRLALEKEESDILNEKNERINLIPFVTADSFADAKTIKTLGMARGSTVRAKHIGRDFLADIKNIVGGEIKGYTELLAEGREEAIYRMKSDADRLGANAVICARFTSSTIGTGISEMVAYGTAVLIEDE